EDLKENQQEIISEHILESSESVKFEESVQTAGQSFREELSVVAKEEQHTEIEDQIGFDDVGETFEENEHLEDRLKSTEAEIHEQETEYAEVEVDPIKMEVDMDEIVSAEELTEAAEDEQLTEFNFHSGENGYAAETFEENEHLEDRLKSTEAEIHEQETEYTEVEVDPIKMEVDMDEIISTEELIELNEELQVDETKVEKKDSVFYEELTAETAEVEENMEGETEELDYQDYSEENAEPDYSAETIGDSVFKEDLFTEIEAEEEISGISEENGDSTHAGETSEDEITTEGIDVHTNDEQVIQYNYGENEETDSAEESFETIETCEGELSEQNDGTQINDFKAENAESDYLGSEQQECKAVEIESDDFNQETETVDCIVVAEEESITSNADESFDDEVRVEDSPGVQNFASEVDECEEEIDNIEATSSKGENKTKISENTEAINQSEQKSGKNNVFLSKTHQNYEKHKSLRNVKIDSEMKHENEESVINTDSSSRSPISELKKELMSLSELIKSTPAKVKSSTEIQNS
ncbi:hypothetical protein OAK48_02090, partial [Deltaproteobacteria bacterium]|nr:hypothetical protein [Deltaproteobacteria bacterium]